MKKSIYIANIGLGLLLTIFAFVSTDDKLSGIPLIGILILMAINFLCGMIFMLGSKGYHIPFFNSIGILLLFLLGLFVTLGAQ